MINKEESLEYNKGSTMKTSETPFEIKAIPFQNELEYIKINLKRSKEGSRNHLILSERLEDWKFRVKETFGNDCVLLSGIIE